MASETKKLWRKWFYLTNKRSLDNDNTVETVVGIDPAAVGLCQSNEK